MCKYNTRCKTALVCNVSTTVHAQNTVHSKYTLKTLCFWQKCLTPTPPPQHNWNDNGRQGVDGGGGVEEGGGCRGRGGGVGEDKRTRGWSVHNWPLAGPMSAQCCPARPSTTWCPLERCLCNWPRQCDPGIVCTHSTTLSHLTNSLVLLVLFMQLAPSVWPWNYLHAHHNTFTSNPQPSTTGAVCATGPNMCDPGTVLKETPSLFNAILTHLILYVLLVLHSPHPPTVCTHTHTHTSSF